MKYILAIIVFIGSIFIMINYQFKYDAANAELSLNKMTAFMTFKEKSKFLNNIELICSDYICSNLDGLVESEINDLAMIHKK